MARARSCCHVEGRERPVALATPYVNANKLDLVRVLLADDASEHVVFRKNLEAGHARRMSAREWHVERRERLRSDHLKDDASRGVQRCLLLSMIATQSCAAILLARVPLWVCLLSGYVGGFVHFGMQQMMHELAHRSPTRLDRVIFVVSDVLFGWSGPDFCAYYTRLHAAHHARVGHEDDPDSAFHALWNRGEGDDVAPFVRRLVRATTVGFLGRLLVLWSARRGEDGRHPSGGLFRRCTSTVSPCLVGAFVAHRYGVASVAHLACSAACAMGAFAHPCLFYWISQHCASPLTAWRPTVSYAGARWTHALFWGALFHAEHHDRPMVPSLSMVRDPPLVEGGVESIRSFIWEWLTRSGEWMDVAGQRRYTELTVSIALPRSRSS